jgi:hypothetical protein
MVTTVSIAAAASDTRRSSSAGRDRSARSMSRVKKSSGRAMTDSFVGK